MEFLAGAIHPTTNLRYICTGKATPTVQNLVYLADSVPQAICDWGKEAKPEAVKFLANLLLHHFGLTGIALEAPLIEHLVNKVEYGKMWLLQREELERWILNSHRPN